MAFTRSAVRSRLAPPRKSRTYGVDCGLQRLSGLQSGLHKRSPPDVAPGLSKEWRRGSLLAAPLTHEPDRVVIHFDAVRGEGLDYALDVGCVAAHGVNAGAFHPTQGRGVDALQ
jgi:hypothetical protein